MLDRTDAAALGDVLRGGGLARFAPSAVLEAPVAGTLARLFFIGAAVDERAARRALGDSYLEGLIAAGALRAHDDRVLATIGISAQSGLFLAHDRHDALHRRADTVLPPGPASRTLAGVTVRRACDTALDVGTGCGYQALLAAAHARRVTATDVNPRALALAQLSCGMNGVDNVECVEGSFFEAVHGQHFDLVVCNPPYVVSPDEEFAYRDAPGDVMMQTVLAGTAEHLNDGGFAHVNGSWGERAGDRAAAVPAGWLPENCDAWVLRTRGESPARYAAQWNDHLRDADPDRYAATVQRWLEHYRDHDVEAIVSAVITLRRTGVTGWRRVDRLQAGPGASASTQVERVFAAQTVLSRELADDAALRRQVFRLTTPHRLEQTLRYADGTYAVQAAFVTADDGVGVHGDVEADAVHLLFLLDGRRPLARLISQVASLTGLPHAEVDVACLSLARRLFGLGLLQRDA